MSSLPRISLPKNGGHSRTRVFALALTTLLGSAGCPAAGDDPYVEHELYDSPGNEFRVRYLAPPWKLIESSSDSVTLRIEGVLFGLGADELPPKYELVVGLEDGDAENLARERIKAAPSELQAVVRGPVEIETDSADQGFETLSVSLAPDERWFRDVYFDYEGRVVHMAFVAFPDLSTAEVDAMISDFDLAPEQ